MLFDVVACQSSSIDRRFDQIRSGGTSIGGGHGMIDGEEILDDENIHTFCIYQNSSKMSMMHILFFVFTCFSWAWLRWVIISHHHRSKIIIEKVLGHTSQFINSFDVVIISSSSFKINRRKSKVIHTSCMFTITIHRLRWGKICTGRKDAAGRLRMIDHAVATNDMDSKSSTFYIMKDRTPLLVPTRNARRGRDTIQFNWRLI